jgi:hypothetical protein
MLGERLTGTFLRDTDGRRPVYGGTEKFQTDPAWRDLVLFFEYFQGDNGAGIGASHQTGWTGCIAIIMQANDLISKEMLYGPDAERAVMQKASEPAEQEPDPGAT